MRSFWIGAAIASIIFFPLSLVGPHWARELADQAGFSFDSFDHNGKRADFDIAFSAVTHFRLYTTECFGPCPVYDIAVFEDGTQINYGRHHVPEEMAGLTVDASNPDHLKRIGRILEKHRFNKFEEKYTDPNHCSNWVTDHPSIMIEVSDFLTTKKVFYYWGCWGFSGEKRLQGMIEELDRELRTDRFLLPEAR
ncbi:MAG: hypothetical protein EP347_07325 [Alphaproteobacteria bacterium]|nr:MAG: hypothetical protein EP347_07325 [Alphaproteobacteria bacterium]